MKCYLQKHFPFFSCFSPILLVWNKKFRKPIIFFSLRVKTQSSKSYHSVVGPLLNVCIHIFPKAYLNPLNMQLDYLLNFHFCQLHLTYHHVFIIYLLTYLYRLPHPPNYLNLRVQSYLQPSREWQDIGVQALLSS